MAPRPTHELKAKIFMEWQVAGFQVWRVFDSSWQLFKQLESIAHQGGNVVTLSEYPPVFESSARTYCYQLDSESLAALNLYLKGFGDLQQWRRKHEAGPWSRWAWKAFCAHLGLGWNVVIKR